MKGSWSWSAPSSGRAATAAPTCSSRPAARGYSLRCIGADGKPGKIAARGNVQVLVDAGTRKLPPRAPTSNVEADGRTYTHLLPEPAARRDRRAGRTRRRRTSTSSSSTASRSTLGTPEHLFRSGTLSRRHARTQLSGQGRRSRTTTVEVQLRQRRAQGQPERARRPRLPARSDCVTVEGVALPTWKVALRRWYNRDEWRRSLFGAGANERRAPGHRGTT